jgi:hypothetical protein
MINNQRHFYNFAECVILRQGIWIKFFKILDPDPHKMNMDPQNK